MIGLFRSKNKMVIISKTEKKVISQQTRKGPYIYDVHMERGLKICLMSPDSFAFKQSIILFIFAYGGGGR